MEKIQKTIKSFNRFHYQIKQKGQNKIVDGAVLGESVTK